MPSGNALVAMSVSSRALPKLCPGARAAVLSLWHLNGDANGHHGTTISKNDLPFIQLRRMPLERTEINQNRFLVARTTQTSSPATKSLESHPMAVIVGFPIWENSPGVVALRPRVSDSPGSSAGNPIVSY